MIDLGWESIRRGIDTGDCIICEDCGEWFFWESEYTDGEHCESCCVARKEEECERALVARGEA